MPKNNKKKQNKSKTTKKVTNASEELKQNETEKAVELMKKLRENGTLIATNIIIDYVNDGKLYPNYDKEKLENEFDYYSWNPYFDGNWDQEKAKVRFKKYIGSNL